jgi:hypothetical protein
LHEEHGIHAKNHIDKSFSWNDNLFRQLRVQLIPEHWFTPLMQGFVEKQEFEGLELILIARRQATRGGTRYHHRGIDEQGYAANYCEFEQIYTYKKDFSEQGDLEVFSYSQIRGSPPMFWTQKDVKKTFMHKTTEFT